MYTRKRTALVFSLLLLAVLTTGYLRYYNKGLGLFSDAERTWERVHRHPARLKTKVSVPVLSKEDVENVRVFMFFIGCPRSGHSILGSMIDSHPDAVVAHEYNLFSKLANDPVSNRTSLYNTLYGNSYKQALSGWRSGEHSFSLKGYNLSLNQSSSWQGRFRTLRVIGDKSGGMTSRLYKKHGQLFSKLYRDLSELVRVPIKVIHVVRNPYDMIATTLMYRFSRVRRQKANFTKDHPLNNETHVVQAMKSMYSEVQAVNNMIQELKLTVLEVHNIDFVNDPEKVIRQVCSFLGLQCSEEYIKMCVANVFRKPSVTRHSLVWSKATREFIDNRILSFPFFQRYSFESNY